MKIFYRSDSYHGESGFIWAWRESMEKNVWGFARTIEEITRRAKNMFPESDIELCALP